MRIARQVAHVAWKDVRTIGWVLVLHLIVVAAGTANVAGVFGEGSALTQLLVLLSATIAVGILLQSDSAVRVGAFWTSLPLSPTAIVLAKIVLVVVTIWSVGVAGQLVALRLYDVPWHRMRGLLGLSAGAYGALLTYAAILAAVTPDLRSFLIGFIFLIPAVQPLQLVVGAERDPVTGPDVALVWTLLTLGTPLAGAAFLAWQYRTRRRWRGLAIGLLAIVALNLVGFVVPTPAPRGRADSAAPLSPDDAPPAVIGIGWARDARMVERGGEIVARPVLRLREPQRHAFLFVPTSAELEIPDGSRESVAVDPEYVWVGSTSLRLEDSRLGMQPLAEPNASPFRSWRFKMSDAQRATVDAHRARIYLHGRLHMLRPRLAGVIPAETGAMALQEGRRFRIEDVRRTAADLTLTVATRRIQEPSPFGTYAHENDLIAHGPVEYVVIAEDERVVEALSRRGGGGSGHGLVLPGPLLYPETLELAMLDRRSITTMPLGEHPKLGLVEWDLVASIPIMSEIPNMRLDAR